MRAYASVSAALMRADDVSAGEKIAFALARLDGISLGVEVDGVRVPRWLAGHERLSAEAKVVYAVCADRLTQTGDYAWPGSLDDVVAACGLTEDDATAAVVELVKAGLIAPRSIDPEPDSTSDLAAQDV